MSETKASAVLHLNGPVLLRQLRELGEIGADPVAGGRTRVALTDAEKAGRDQVVAWMRELDLDVQIDRIGNIFGTLPSRPITVAAFTNEEGARFHPDMMGSLVHAGGLQRGVGRRHRGEREASWSLVQAYDIGRGSRRADDRAHRPCGDDLRA